ncbi:MAG: hypothetical protein ACO3CQ_00850 [Candidatus Nanopelagicaceae bacterium]
MGHAVDDVSASHQVTCGAGYPYTSLLLGPARIRGSSYIEGPSIFGNPNIWPNVWATVMIGPNTNLDSPPTFAPGAMCWGGPAINNPYSLATIGNSGFFGSVDVAGNMCTQFNVIAQGEVVSRCGAHILSLKKNFDITHPTKRGWRLRHTCPEGPSNDVYIRGQVRSKDYIDLPEYWKGLVDHTSITVNLTPIGAHQDVIVKRIDEDKVYLQSKGNMPIHCFYHIYGERKDGERLIPEYQGETPADYPGDNTEYSIVGWNYDKREEDFTNLRRA